MKGWIAIDRRITEHWIWQDAKMCQRWIDLLLLASYEDKMIKYKWDRIMLKRGQVIFTARWLMGRWQTNYATITNLFNALKEDEMVKIQVFTKYSILTIVNYDDYQNTEVIPGENEEISVTPYAQGNTYGNAYGNGKGNAYGNVLLIKQNNNINNISHITRARTCEEVEKDLVEAAKCDMSFLENTAIALRIDIFDISKWLDRFLSENLAKMKSHKDSQDFRTHFVDWLRIQKYNSKQNKNSNGYDKQSSRRGTEVEAQSANDYKGAF